MFNLRNLSHWSTYPEIVRSHTRENIFQSENSTGKKIKMNMVNKYGKINYAIMVNCNKLGALKTTKKDSI